jgi:hypothetical protein
LERTTSGRASSIPSRNRGGVKKKSSEQLVEEESETTFLSTQTPSEIDELYLESDEENPLQIIYDLDNDRVIVPTSEEDSSILDEQSPSEPIRKTFKRNVGNSRRRNSR